MGPFKTRLVENHVFFVSDYQQGTTWMCIPIGIHSTILNVLLANTEVSGYGLPVVGMQQACYLWVLKKKAHPLLTEL